MKKLIVLIYIATATLLFGYVKAGTLNHACQLSCVTVNNQPAVDFPVNFEDLSVKMIENKVEINWSSVIDQNNKQFEIQRSTGDEPFKTIAIIFTLSDSKDVKNYNFKDDLKGVSSAKVIYRIKQVDTSEGYTFSKWVSLSLQKNSKSL
ncbi:MAG TPA: hypothetical protein VFV68_14160 [Agriterribacter sp.]|nr:hypothetical protein [Agriterribacter sp.]